MPSTKASAVKRRNQRSRNMQLKNARKASKPVAVNASNTTSSSSICASSAPSPHQPSTSTSSVHAPPSPSTQSTPTPFPHAPTPVSASKRKLDSFKDFVPPSNNDNAEYMTVDFSLLQHLIDSLRCPTCHNDSLQFQRCSRPHMGMAFNLKVYCSICEDHVGECLSSKKLSTQQTTYDINRRVALAVMAMGLGQAGLSSFCEVMGMRPLSKSGFQDHKKEIEVASTKAKTVLLTKTHDIVREAYASAHLSTPDDEGILNLSVSYDGSWHKRGFTSRHGLGCVTDTVTGLVVDFETISQHCQPCATTGKSLKEESRHGYDEWWSSHKDVCQANHQGSSGLMEVAAAKNMWLRSLNYNFRYTTMVGDGDSKTHNEIVALAPYGEDHLVAKEECISHFSKRLGTALRKAVTTAKTKGVTLGGVRHGSLTQNKMALMQKFFTKALLKHPGDLESMRKAIWAIYLHATSSDQSPQHQNCPTGESSWCPHQKALSQSLPPPPHNSSIILNSAVAGHIRPIFERLTTDEILKRCLQGQTQDPNESVHSVIWNFVPKGRFVGSTRIRLGLYLGAGQFNCGSQSLYLLMKQSGLVVTETSLTLGSARDQERICQAEKSAQEESKRRRE